MFKKLLMIYLAFILISVFSGISASGRAKVGAIRWDDWVTTENYPYSTWSRFLEPEQWHYRHPFFAQLEIGKLVLRCDNQESTDQEIAYAKQAGLDYFAYGYYFPGQWTGADRYNYCLYQYLASTHKSDVNFCMRLAGSSVGAATDWPTITSTLVNLFKEPTYQTVAGGRPLVYMFDATPFSTLMGSDANAKTALTALRTAATDAGCGSPYIVCMVWGATEGSNLINNCGYNAMSAYTAISSGSNQEYPYSTLTAANVTFWNACKAKNKKVIPIVNIGWDDRPHDYHNSPWYTEPTMTEWKNHLQAAINWVNTYPSTAEPNAIIIYAWNELTEGGWMVPTRGAGTTRIEATTQVLNP
jgi:hypothetical protein